MVDLIITRPEPDASSFARFVAERKITSVLSPIMSIVYNEINPALPNLAGVNALAFTSANGVRAFMHYVGAQTWQEKNSNYDILSLPTYAIGDGTARALRQAGFENIDIADGDGKSLAALILQKELQKNSIIYHSAGRDRQGDLVGRLERGGLMARREVLYRAQSIEHVSDAAKTLIVNPEWRGGVCFFSPRSARLFLEQILAENLQSHLGRLTAYCLSPAVATVLKDGLCGGFEAKTFNDLISSDKRCDKNQKISWQMIKTCREVTIESMRDLLTP